MSNRGPSVCYKTYYSKHFKIVGTDRVLRLRQDSSAICRWVPIPLDTHSWGSINLPQAPFGRQGTKGMPTSNHRFIFPQRTNPATTGI